MGISRRDFIKISGAVCGGLTLNIMLPFSSKSANVGATTFEPNLLVKISTDNVVTFTLTKQEMGQGVTTGMPMIFADEMGADLREMKVIYSDYNAKVEHVLQGITGGSSSIQRCWGPLRESAAIAREILIQSAAEIWTVDKNECYTENSKVIHRLSGKERTFGSLVEKAKQIPIPQQVKLKETRDFRYIGKPIKSVTTKDIVTGRYTYGIDVSVPEMLYASIERSPVHLGKIKSFDDKKARKIKGVVNVIRIDRMIRPVSAGVPGWDFFYDYTIEEGLAVVATSTWAAIKGRKELKIEWEDGENSSAGQDLFHQRISSVSESDLQINEQKGDLPGAFAKAKKTVEESYEIPYMAHCVMEPLNTTASVQNNFCELWSGTQFAKRFVEEVSSVLNIPNENVRCHVLPAGGGFGRRWEADFEDEIQHDFFHSPQQDRHRVALDENNIIFAWNTDQYCCFKFPQSIPWNPYAYSVENYRARKIDLASPIETGPWRSVGEHKDAFTLESFIDEVAHTVKVDPLKYRLDLLTMPIHMSEKLRYNEIEIMKLNTDRVLTKQVLELAAEKAGWGTKTNLGIAVGRFNSHCAQVAEVDIEKGQLLVKKITIAIHCGMVINPLLVETQLQGAVVFALQALHYGGITIKNGRVQQSNFHDYKMLRMNEVPEISVHVIPSTDSPKGIGEPGVPALAPAVLNAIFAATGKRIRKIPVLKEDFQ